MPAPQRSILPSVPGIPVGAAVLIAVACTFVGFLIDASGGGGELTGTFAALYIVGCMAAVAAVRYRGLFSTMVLPPLLLFVAVPLAYQQLTGRGSTSMKDILLNLAIPLVNRFPTMMLATLAVALIGGARILMRRREEEASRPLPVRRGASGGKTPAKKTKPGRSSGTLAEAARRKARRPRPEPDEPDPDNLTTPPPARPVGPRPRSPTHRHGSRRPARARAAPRHAAAPARPGPCPAPKANHRVHQGHAATSRRIHSPMSATASVIRAAPNDAGRRVCSQGPLATVRCRAVTSRLRRIACDGSRHQNRRHASHPWCCHPA